MKNDIGSKGSLLFKKHSSNFPLQNVEEPNLLRDQFPYTQVPRITFDDDYVKLDPPRDIWITDTTFRDGQQSRQPFTVQQIVDIYTLLSQLNGTSSLIRQSEFFLYTEKDRQAVEKCLELGCRFPEVTGWIRAVISDFKLVKDMGLKETGMLTSCSDYHIFLKLKKNRKECMKSYLTVVRAALEEGIRPRCHFEDITRADIYGFVVPFAIELMKLRDQSRIPIKIRMCDTMGYGVTYPEATLPRSLPKIIRALVQDAGVPSELLEWHGHNDFHRSHANAAAAWLYGCSGVNCAVIGIGERTGNSPLEAAVIEYLQLVGEDEGIDTKVITEIAEYFRDSLNYNIPANMPLVGENFNVTSAGIHIDGILKNEEIYNIFDTTEILGRKPRCVITDKSGVAGVAQWVNDYLDLEPQIRIPKSHSGVIEIYELIHAEFSKGRVTSISDEEMLRFAKAHLPEYFETDLNALKKAAVILVDNIISKSAKATCMKAMNREQQEQLMWETVKQHSFINLMFAVNVKGEKHTSFITATGPLEPEIEAKLDRDYSSRRWFLKPLETGKINVTDLFTSRINGLLGMTVSCPIKNDDGEDIGVLRIDVKFEDLLKAARD